MANDMIFRINFLLKQIDSALQDIDGKTLEEFGKSDLLVRATCFSITQIGEQMIKLEKLLKDKYPELPWTDAKRMRNLIVRVYHKVDAAQVYKTAIEDLPSLKTGFEKVKKDLTIN